MAPNTAKYVISNGTDDRVSLFDDGRVKVWSTTHLWTEQGRVRHNASGQTVMVTLDGSFRPKTVRESDFRVELSETSVPRPNRLYQDEFLVT
ncbi:hypothetical protein ACFXK0_21655 [Nocardia sp. NPDC059177]|uniref:hypothetical protein n=1 Tax=Nocardia sp. NPDC059177 TaxID=3346759 RepID=UPI0036B66CBA